MKKWKNIRVRQELAAEAEKEVKKSQYKSLSEFVSESIQLRLQTLAKERIQEYLERDKLSRTTKLQGKLLYTPKHIWVTSTPQGTVKLGISEYFCQKCHGITFLELTAKVGEMLSKNEPFAIAETPGWWFLHDLCCPINGMIAKVNNEVINDPLILSEDPSQWIVEVQPSDSEFYKEIPQFLSSEEYKELITVCEDRNCLPSDSEVSEIIKKIKS